MLPAPAGTEMVAGLAVFLETPCRSVLKLLLLFGRGIGLDTAGVSVISPLVVFCRFCGSSPLDSSMLCFEDAGPWKL